MLIMLALCVATDTLQRRLRMNLRQLAVRVVETDGLQHQMTLRTLRMHLNTTPEAQLIKEMADLDTSKMLRAVWEAGVTKSLQDAYFKALNKVKESEESGK